MLSHVTTQDRCLVNAVDGSLKEGTPEIDVKSLKSTQSCSETLLVTK